MNCRFCAEPATRTFIDLGMQPLSNSYVQLVDRDKPETFYPLHARVCESCLLVQLPECASRGDHLQRLCVSVLYQYVVGRACGTLSEAAIRTFGLTSRSRVVEVASNDGYLLQHFLTDGIGVLGVEPAANVAEVARKAGIPTVLKFFGRDLAGSLGHDGLAADLLVANNVLAHVPDLNDFVSGLATS